MKRTNLRLFPGFLSIALAWVFFSCQETYPPLADSEKRGIPHAIVAVEQSLSATEASI